jgi:hypothetical protein
VGSFMVFALWIGLGAGAMMQALIKNTKGHFMQWILGILILVLVPGLMWYENSDDHNRSGRYAARDFGKNILSSCEKNAILLTTADNDTYPIWYLQQVENFRPDVRQVLTTFLSIDWYGVQMNHIYEGCGSVPVSFKDEELLMKQNQYFPVLPRIDSAIDVKELVQFIKNTDSRTKIRTQDGETLNFVPGKNLSLAVDKENFINGNKFLEIDPGMVPSTINFTISKNYLSRDELLILDMLANNNWERPVYTIYPSVFQEIGLADYLHREGMLFRLLPYKNTNVLHNRKAFAIHQFKLITQSFVWGNVNDPHVFLDHTIRQMAESFRFRQMFAKVADELIDCGENEKAGVLIDLALSIFPENKFQYDYFSAELARCYYKIGSSIKGDTLAEDIFDSADQNLAYFLQGNNIGRNTLNSDAQLQAFLMQEIIRITGEYNSRLKDKLLIAYEKYY